MENVEIREEIWSSGSKCGYRDKKHRKIILCIHSMKINNLNNTKHKQRFSLTLTNGDINPYRRNFKMDKSVLLWSNCLQKHCDKFKFPYRLFPYVPLKIKQRNIPILQTNTNCLWTRTINKTEAVRKKHTHTLILLQRHMLNAYTTTSQSEDKDILTISRELWEENFWVSHNNY